MRVFAFLILIIFSMPAIAANEIYICPMHPHIEGEVGETCPICGMALVPKESSAPMSIPPEMDSMPDKNTTYINPTFMQALGVKTTTVSYYNFGRNIRAYGEIIPSTRNETLINMRTEGWIVDLATDAVGDTVKKGDLLFTYYSPDLMNAQSDYLIGSRVNNAEDRLRLYGMDDKAITEFKKLGRMMKATPFYAPADGTVIDLKVRKGSFVKTGDPVLAFQDFNEVWVNADVPIRDLQFLSEGQPADIIVPETGKTFNSSIDFIHHVADSDTRTGMVRLVLPHEHLEPKPGTYVDVVFNANVADRLAIPAEAVLYGSEGAKVIESLGDGMFKPVNVKTGITSDGYTEILDGLMAGQKIVASGQFMIDAESSLRGGMSSMGDMNMDNDMPDMDMEGGRVH